jgi:N-acetylglucosamine kinase-like BadF-type ATPase
MITKCDTDVPNVIASAFNIDREINGCVAVICGTVSVAFTYDNGSCIQTGGWGNLLDTAGSGYDFGREAICAALSERDELGAATLITSMVEARLGGAVKENISKVYTNDKGYIASFAPIVFDAYAKGDAVASEIIEKGTDRLAQLIDRAAKNLEDGALVVISGGLMIYKDVLLEQIKRKVHKNLKFVVPEFQQIYGAAVLCARLCGFKDKLFCDNFNNDYKKLLMIRGKSIC